MLLKARLSPQGATTVLVLALGLAGCQAPQPVAFTEVPRQYKEAEILGYRYAYPTVHLSVWNFGCTQQDALRLLVEEDETHHQLRVFRPKRERCQKTKVPMEAEFDLGQRLDKAARIKVKLPQ